MYSIGHHFFEYLVGTCCVLALITVIVNGSVIVIVIHQKHRLLRHIFYMLVMNFAVNDILRGGCLIAWSTPVFCRLYHQLDQTEVHEFNATSMLAYFRSLSEASNSTLPNHSKSCLRFLEVSSYATHVQRLCNLNLILNLMLTTLHEYVYIQYPLRYHKLFSPCRICCGIVFNWFISAMIIPLKYFTRANTHMFVPKEMNNSSNNTWNGFLGIRRGNSWPGAMYIVDLSLIALCVVCLIVVIRCYRSFFKTILALKYTRDQKYQRNVQPADGGGDEIETLETTANTMDYPLDEQGRVRQFLKRYKYAVIIGMVIAMYTAFLLLYGLAQIFHFVAVMKTHKKMYIVLPNLMTLIFIGLHSCLQPLCYFRMREIRKVTLPIRRLLERCCARLSQSAGRGRSFHRESMICQKQRRSLYLNRNYDNVAFNEVMPLRTVRKQPSFDCNHANNIVDVYDKFNAFCPVANELVEVDVISAMLEPSDPISDASDQIRAFKPIKGCTETPVFV